MKKTNLLILLLLLVGVAGAGTGQNNQTQAARREDRDLVSANCARESPPNERRDYEVAD